MESNRESVEPKNTTKSEKGKGRCTTCLLTPCIVERNRGYLESHVMDAVIVDNASNPEIYNRLCDVLSQRMQCYRKDTSFQTTHDSLPVCCKEGARGIIKKAVAKIVDYSSDGTQWSEESDCLGWPTDSK